MTNFFKYIYCYSYFSVYSKPVLPGSQLIAVKYLTHNILNINNDSNLRILNLTRSTATF